MQNTGTCCSKRNILKCPQQICHIDYTCTYKQKSISTPFFSHADIPFCKVFLRVGCYECQTTKNTQQSQDFPDNELCSELQLTCGQCHFGILLLYLIIELIFFRGSFSLNETMDVYTSIFRGDSCKIIYWQIEKGFILVLLCCESNANTCFSASMIKYCAIPA